MKLTTTLISLAMGISVTMAGPTPSSTDMLSVNTPPDQGTCFSYSDVLSNYEHFEVKVGRPYIEGLGCEPIKVTLIQHMGELVDYTCKSDGGGDSTILDFISGSGDVDADNAHLMDALREAYPMVTWDRDTCIVMPVEKKTLASRTTPDYATCSTDPDVGHGGTHLAFQSGPSFEWDANMKVLDVLHEAYPMVTFDDLCVAVPVKQRSFSERIPLDTGKCFRYNHPHVEEGSYLVYVGRPYNEGAGCDPVKTTLIEHIGRVGQYNCVDDGEGGTTIRFFAGTNATTEHDNIKVFAALDEAYPTVSFQDDQCIVKKV